MPPRTLSFGIPVGHTVPLPNLKIRGKNFFAVKVRFSKIKGTVCDSCGCPTAKFVGEEPEDQFYELGTLNQYRFYVDKKMDQYRMLVCIENGGGVHTIEVVNEANTP